MEQEPENSDLSDWLEQHGLARYGEAMLAQDIDLRALEHLTDDDLREIGFSIGHRKAFNQAMNSFVSGPVKSSDAAAAATRRQITILFCDLVNSTGLSASIDAEDMAVVLERYLGTCTRIIESWGGLALGSAGDGIVACFGYPRAHENDAERCVSAGLEISRTLPGLQFDGGVSLKSRIGIATGRVLVRGQVKDTSSLVGDTMNLAARLQDEAPVNAVVVGGSTKKLIEQIADLAPLESRRLRGFTDVTDIWQVNTLRDAIDRAEPDKPVEERAVRGREAELEKLQSLWGLTRSGQGQVAVVTGEPGIGKTCLLGAFRQKIAADGSCNTIRYHCAPFFENSALFPIRSSLQRAFGLEENEDVETVIAKLASFFPHQTERAVPLIADLLSVDTGDFYPPLDMTPVQRKSETFAVLLAQLIELSTHSPVLVIVEDMHWADPSTREFFALCVEQAIASNPIMLLVMQRPQSDIGGSEQAHVTHLRLGKLSENETRQIISLIASPRVLPENIVRRICENADGVPLYAEELTRSVIAQSNIGGFASVKVPVTLRDSLAERLDRLTTSKPLIDMASIIGRRFAKSLLREILQINERSFSDAVEEPIDAKIIEEENAPQSDVLRFRHALVQQAAYEGVLRSKRRELHGKIAELLNRDYPSMQETEPETLARHYAGAGQADLAIKFLVIAGKKATSRAAQVEATNHYLMALELIETLPHSKERDHEEVLLRALLGGALMATRGFAAPEVFDAFARARALCIELGDSPIYCLCLYGLFTVEASRSNKEAAIALAAELLDTFGASQVPSWAIAAHFSAGVSRFFQGQFLESESCFKAALDLYTEDQHGPMVEQFHDNLGEFSICYLQWLYVIQGDVGKSGAYLEQAQKMANDLNNKNAQVRSIAFRMGRQHQLGDLDGVADLAPRVVEIASSQGYPYWACAGQIGLGWVLANQGKPEGIAHIESSLAFFDTIGQRNPQAYWRTYLIGAHIALGQRTEALAAAGKALDLAKSGLESFYLADVLRLKATALLLDNADTAQAEACLRDAITTAEASHAHFFRFRAAYVLAQLFVTQGKRPEAADILRLGISSISTSAPFPHLDQAQDLLASLS
ncbi:AAA family ATPase [Sulfitobacter sp.]|uniref:AAA family ATPase n=1 Tax=Sulfitobacter sp. TaxID=1903071 RepID=UPI0030019834